MIKYLKQFALLVCLLFCTVMQAVDKEELMRLEADMQKYFTSTESDTFIHIADRLKEISKEAGDERLFYKAWSNQAIYEATHQDYPKALGIA
jgi:hypothetical protein